MTDGEQAEQAERPAPSEDDPDREGTGEDGRLPAPSGATRLPGLRAAARRNRVVGAAVARLATWSLRLLIIAAALVLLLWVLGRLWVIVLPVLLGLLLATVLWPPARWLRRVMPPALASLLVLLVALLVLVGLGFWLAPQVIEESQGIGDAVAAGVEDLRDWLTGPPLNLGEEQVASAVDQVQEQALSLVQGNTTTIAGGLLAGVTTVGSLLLTALLAVVLCFFYLKDGPRFLPWFSAVVGAKAAPHVEAVAGRAWHTVSGFIRAQALVGLVDAVFIGIGLAVLGVPLVLPLSVLIFFGAFVPIVGATVTGALAALVALVTEGFTTALIVVALVIVVQQLEGNVFQPFVVGGVLALHPAVVILAVTAGAALFGIIGAFLSVPLVAVVTNVIRYARQELEVVDEAPAASHDP